MGAMKKYIAYFDSGTSNTRLYLLDENMELVDVSKEAVGSKDSAVAGTNKVLLSRLKEMYDRALERQGLREEQIRTIYASGMSTSPYGIKEYPHQTIPISLQDFVRNHPVYYEPDYFRREIELIPGLKTVGSSISEINNMRGEEIEIIGAMGDLPQSCAGKRIAMIMPGSHTHVALIQDGNILDILSTFSGELFHALKTETILAPVLSAEADGFSEAYVRLGYENLTKYGFNRALYICHAMRVFNTGTETERLSYGEGVIMGDILTALEQRCTGDWAGCDTAVIVSGPEMHELFRILFAQSAVIKELIWLPIGGSKSYALEGLKIIERLKEN